MTKVSIIHSPDKVKHSSTCLLSQPSPQDRRIWTRQSHPPVRGHAPHGSMSHIQHFYLKPVFQTRISWYVSLADLALETSLG